MYYLTFGMPLLLAFIRSSLLGNFPTTPPRHSGHNPGQKLDGQKFQIRVLIREPLRPAAELKKPMAGQTIDWIQCSPLSHTPPILVP